MRILVTGAKGFIGTHLVKRLSEIGHTPLIFEGDVCNPGDLLKYQDAQAEHCIHLAARSFVPASWTQPEEFIRVNVSGTANVLELCRKLNIGLTFLSSYLYGIPGKLPISETDPVSAPNPYALSKLLAEETCKFFSDHYKMDLTVIRPFNIYGPGQDERFLIPELFKKIYTEETTLKVLDLEPKRDYIYIDDLIELILVSIDKTKGYQVLNAGSGVSYSVQEIIEMIMKVSAIRKPVVDEQTKRKNEIPDTIADIQKAIDFTGWKPSVSMEEGLRRMNAFYRHTMNLNN